MDLYFPCRTHAARGTKLSTVTTLTFILVVYAVSAAHFRSATAQDTSEQDKIAKLLATGLDHFAAGRFDEATTAFQQAVAKPGPADLRAQAQLHLGLCHAALNQADMAKAEIRRALETDPTLTLDQSRYKQDFIRLFQSVQKSLSGLLVIRTTGRRAFVSIDDGPLSSVPLTIDTPPGVHTIIARDKQGRLLGKKVVRVDVDKTTKVLFRTPRTTDKQTAPPAYRDSLPSRPSEAEQDTASPAAVKPAQTRLWTWITLGAAVAASAAGLGLELSSAKDRRSACTLLASPPESCSDRTVFVDEGTRQQYSNLYNSSRNKRTGAVVSFSLAGALLATSVVLFFLEGRKEIEKQSVAILPRWGGAGFTW